MEVLTIIFDKSINDFVLTVKYPSGKIVTILIPADDEKLFSYATYGLNLVTEGHYNG